MHGLANFKFNLTICSSVMNSLINQSETREISSIRKVDSISIRTVSVVVYISMWSHIVSTTLPDRLKSLSGAEPPTVHLTQRLPHIRN